MKNLKKVLAMVLAFACTFTMFASAVVYDDVPAGSDHSEAITMLSDLGIIQGKTDGKYHPEATITRAEACALIARLLTGDPNVSNFGGAQNFTDIVKGSWQESAVGYCVANGITVGVGNGKFEPNRAINDQEFLTMLVRALGYETPDMKQGYPFSYMSAARAIGLVDNTQMLANTDALRDEDAQVIYNALFADYAKGAKLFNTTHGSSIEKYPTLAETVWHLDRAAVGTWDKKDKEDETATLTHCKAHTWVVIGHDPNEKNHILAYPIEDEATNLYDSKEKNAFRTYSFKYEGTTDIDSIKGYKVELWGEGTHGQPTWDKGDNKFVFSENWKIRAIKTVKGQTKHDYNPSQADSKSDNGTIELGENSLKLESVASNAKNVETAAGGALDQFVAKGYNDESKMDTNKKVEAALNIRDGAQYKLMDWDSDGDIDWIVVDTANYYKVESVTAKSVTVSWMKPDAKSMSWETSKESLKETWKRDGATGNFRGDKDFEVKYAIPEDVKQGDILEVVYKTTLTSKKTLEGTVSVVDAKNHKLEKVSTKGGLTLTFDDQEIKVAQNNDKGDVIVPTNPSAYRDFNNEELGTEFALHLNRNGFILHSDYVTERANYAMVLDTADGTDRVSSRKYGKVDLLTGDNKHLKDVELTSTAVIDTEGAYKDRKFNESKIVGNVYKYWTNDKGQITRMRQVIDPKMASNIDATEYTYKADSDTLKDKNNKYVASLKDADAIFAVKPSNRKEFMIGQVDNNTNAGYIQTDGNNFFVDADDVLAVKQSDIPDIALATGDTQAAMLDNKHNMVNRTQTWLGADNDAANHTYTNKFVAQLDKNGKAEAAVLGVNNFNKFGAGSTKIGLVTDVTYANHADGKYVELTASFGGENKTISSVKKVDFDNVVKAYDAKNDKDIAVGSPSVKVNNTLFKNTAFDKYLEDSAAYAEITTDKDGNLTKVTFLDVDKNNAHNKLVGHYYTVSRNVTLDANEKAVSYMLNDGSSQSAANTKDHVAKQYYANDKKLYSVPQNLARNRSTFASDATFYSIKGRATRMDRKYDGKELTVVDGFERTPDITAGGTFSVIEHSSIDNQSNDYYAVADIALNNSGDVAAVYAFDDTFAEVEANDVAVVSMTQDNKSITEVKANTSVDLTAVVVDSNSNKTLTGIKIVNAAGNDVTTEWIPNGATVTDAKHNTWTNVKVPATATGEYTIYALNGTTEYKIGALKVKVTDGKQAKWSVDTLAFVTPDGNNGYKTMDPAKVAAKNVNTIYVYVGDNTDAVYASVNGVTPNMHGVTGLTAKDFAITVNSNPAVVKSCVATKEPGVYELTLDKTLSSTDPKSQVTVKLNANANLTLDSMLQSGVTGYVETTSADQGGQTTLGGVPAKLQIISSTDGVKIVTLKILDAEGKPANVKNIVVPGAGSFVKNGDGSYTLTSTATLSEKTIVVDGKSLKLPTLADGNASIAPGAVQNYALLSSRGDTMVDLMSAATTVTNMADPKDNEFKFVDVTIVDAENKKKDNTVMLSVASKKVQAKASELNKLMPGDTIKFKLEVNGIQSTEVSVKIEKVGNINASKSTYDPKTEMLTIELDGDYTVLKSELEAAKWNEALKVMGAAGNLTTAGAMTVEGTPTVEVTDTKTTVTMKIKFHSGAKLHAGDSVTGTDVFEDVILQSGTTVKPAQNVTIARKELKTFDVTLGNDKRTITVTVDDEATATYLANLGAVDAKAVFEIKTADQNDMAGGAEVPSNITAKAAGKVVTLTLDNDLTAQKWLTVALKETDLYKMHAASPAQQIQ